MKSISFMTVTIASTLLFATALPAGDSPGGCFKKPARTAGGADTAAGGARAALTSLEGSLEPLVEAFNAGAAGPRLVALLSPTCGGCVYAAEAVLAEAVLGTGDEDLTILIVWEPMLASDDLDAARRMAARFDDPRVRQYWDPERASGIAYSRDAFPEWLDEMAASLPAGHELTSYCSRFAGRSPEKAPMWDFVAYYPPGVRWDDRAPRPDAFSKQALFYGKNENGESGTFWRNAFASAPLESDWYVEVRHQLTRP